MPIILGLIALVVVTVAGFELVGVKVEKFVTHVAADVTTVAHEVLNPGVLILVVVGLFIVYGGLHMAKGAS